MIEPISTEGCRDFDFIVGQWRVHNRRLVARLSNCNEWEEFVGTCQAKLILEGLGNFDEVTFQRTSGTLAGCTLRLFNPATQEWSIYWSDNQSGVLFPPMIGKFNAGVGEFYAQEMHQQRTVLSRFIWSGITNERCHWEQALSADGGRNWETNWTMDFSRVLA